MQLMGIYLYSGKFIVMVIELEYGCSKNFPKKACKKPQGDIVDMLLRFKDMFDDEQQNCSWLLL